MTFRSIVERLIRVVDIEILLQKKNNLIYFPGKEMEFSLVLPKFSDISKKAFIRTMYKYFFGI